jgi:predicted nucleic acid-binding protein
VIAYVDSSVLARAYLGDEDGSGEARRLLDDRSVAKYTGRLTRLEVSATITRATRAGRAISPAEALGELDADLRPDGRVKLLAAPAEQVEETALELARTHGLRALDALHVALASITVPRLADRGEPIAFASRDDEQAAVAASFGFVRI